MRHSFQIFCFLVLAFGYYSVSGEARKDDSLYIREHYVKSETLIPMRDGVRLFTAIYAPKDSRQDYPFLIERTPYSCSPYGTDHYPNSLPANSALLRGGYIIVIQDVRGRYMSEGNFEEMTPAIDHKQSNHDTDESSDTFDTIEWLLKNVRNNNGRAGILGISYPGFYSTAALPDAHPALRAVSPQAPVTDEFIGDDVYHNGAFFLLDNFGFYNYFDGHRKGPVKDYTSLVNVKMRDSYDFLLDLGPVKNVNEKYFHKRGKIWNELVAHNTYDDYWKARNIRPHLTNIKPAVLLVGGWFDAEDLFGPLRTYETIEQTTPDNHSFLVMGPWTHGAWASAEWTKFAGHAFGVNVNQMYQETEAGFFDHYLKDKDTPVFSEATIFDTGTYEWSRYDAWPPKAMQSQKLFLQEKGALTMTPPTSVKSSDTYVSDPMHPVPYTDKHQGRRDNEYMALDQRFVKERSDVLTYKTDILPADMHMAGPLTADLFVSTTGTDADFIVKVIDVSPDDQGPAAGREQLVRAEVFRGKFRNSFEKPEAFTPGETYEIKYALNAIAHTFKKGHRIMIQIQSSWFPLVDRNPQKFIDIGKAEASDFQKATHQIYHDLPHPSHIVVPVLK